MAPSRPPFYLQNLSNPLKYKEHFVKKNLVTIALALAATAVFAQDKKPTPAPAPAEKKVVVEDADPVIITAGDLKIRQSEFEAAIKTLPDQYQQFAMSQGKKQFAEDYLRMKLLASQGMKDNLQNDPDVVKQLGLMRENLVASAEVKKIEASLPVSDADIKKAYDDNKKEYEQVTARHILVAFKGSPAAQAGKKELTDDEAKAKAEDIRKQLVGGADFAALAKKESDDTGSGARGGDLGSFGHGQMVPEFEKAAFETKAGEISPVTKTQYGYHLIKVEKHDSTPYENVKPTLEKNMKQKKLQEAIDSIKDTAKPVYSEAYFPPPPPPPAATPAAPATPKSDAKKPEVKKDAAKKP
jgi:peptidyl-prolyl cis-trans isomerase C